MFKFPILRNETDCVLAFIVGGVVRKLLKTFFKSESSGLPSQKKQFAAREGSLRELYQKSNKFKPQGRRHQPLKKKINQETNRNFLNQDVELKLFHKFIYVLP